MFMSFNVFFFTLFLPFSLQNAPTQKYLLTQIKAGKYERSTANNQLKLSRKNHHEYHICAIRNLSPLFLSHSFSDETKKKDTKALAFGECQFNFLAKPKSVLFKQILATHYRKPTIKLQANKTKSHFSGHQLCYCTKCSRPVHMDQAVFSSSLNQSDEKVVL